MVAVPNVNIRKLLLSGELKIQGMDNSHIQPASVDIGPMKGEIWITDVYSNSIQDEYLKRHAHLVGSFSEGFVFQIGSTYVIRGPDVTLPFDVEAFIEQKSTTGRLGLFNELLIPHLGSKFVTRTNHIPAGYSGPTFFVIESRAFPIELRPGDSIAQLRLRKKDSGYLTHNDLKTLYGKTFGYYNIFSKNNSQSLVDPAEIIHENTTAMTPNIEFVLIQKHAMDTPIVYSKKESANLEDYWQVLLNKEKYLRIPAKTLILISSAEAVVTGPELCWKMGMKSEGLGIHVESHRAGFGDPGFQGRITAELINHHKAFILSPQRHLSYLKWESLETRPDSVYGDNQNSYQYEEGPLPPKQFSGFSSVWEDVKSGEIKPILKGAVNIEEFFRPKNV